MMMVLPMRRSSRRISIISMRARGSRPLAGSSSKAIADRESTRAARQPEALLHAPTQRADETFFLAQAHQFQHVADRLLALRRRDAITRRRNPDTPSPPCLYRRRRNPACNRSCRTASASRTTSCPKHFGRTGLGAQKRGEDAERRRLARAVRPDERTGSPLFTVRSRLASAVIAPCVREPESLHRRNGRDFVRHKISCASGWKPAAATACSRRCVWSWPDSAAARVHCPATTPTARHYRDSPHPIHPSPAGTTITRCCAPDSSQAKTPPCWLWADHQSAAAAPIKKACCRCWAMLA